MNVSKLKRQVRWIITNATLCILAYLAIDKEIIGAEYLFLFLIWLNLIASVFIVSLIRLIIEVKEAKEAKGESLKLYPYVMGAYISAVIDALLIGYLVWNGWIGSGIIIIISSVLYFLFAEEIKQHKTKTTK